VNLETKKFIKFLFNNGAGGYIYSGGKSALSGANYLIKADKKVFKKIVSDPYWINYPTYQWSKDSSKPYGYSISTITGILLNSGPEIEELLANNARGIFLSSAFKLADGYFISKVVGRGILSKDRRVRAQAAKHAPTPLLVGLLQDPRSEVRSVAASRLGYFNYGSRLVNDRSQKIRCKAITHTDIKNIEWEDFLDKMLEKKKNLKTKTYWNGGTYKPELPWAEDKAVASILKRISKKDLERYKDLATGWSSRRVYEQRIGA